jgi:serine/threonine-protein kinase PknG
MSAQCVHPGCGGIIGADGACEDCGRAASVGSLLAAVSVDNVGELGSMGIGAQEPSAFPSARAPGASRLGSSRGQAPKGALALPMMPSEDPLLLVMKRAEIPPSKRRCPHCGGQATLIQGFCPHCGKAYDFEPTLRQGDVIAGKLLIKGPMAFGGLGWIYLAWDRDLERWAVLKGLLNAKDEAAAAAAVAERQFLAAVKHPKIVSIYDFVQHGSESFIVMELVGGRTVENLRKELDDVDAYGPGRDPAHAQPVYSGLRKKLPKGLDVGEVLVSKRGVLPPDQACAYVLAILPAFARLHEQGVVYCDFKPDNFMAEGDDVKLIDLGGARKIGDPGGDIFGTIGFMAPEASEDPLPVSDLYSVGRTLACLTMNFPHQKENEATLPSPLAQPILAQWESLHRFLLRATHPEPAERFQNAHEMADQLRGVLREMAALQGAGPQPFDSAAFGPDRLVSPDDGAAMSTPLARALPALKNDPGDPGAAEVARLEAIPGAEERLAALRVAHQSMPQSAELGLRLADALRERADFAEAHNILDSLQGLDPFDWRVQWERGKCLLTQGQGGPALDEFERVFFEMPGELAPKLARAFALEAQGRQREALALFERVARVDPRMAGAIFGMARTRASLGDAQGARAAYESIPEDHSLHAQSRLRAAKTLVEQASPDLAALIQACQAIEAAASDSASSKQLAGVALLRAARLVQASPQLGAGATLLGSPAEEQALRRAAEAQFRAAARMATTELEKIQWVDMANRARPRSLF